MSAAGFRASLFVVGVALSFMGFDSWEKGNGGGVWVFFGLGLVVSALPLAKKEG